MSGAAESQSSSNTTKATTNDSSSQTPTNHHDQRQKQQLEEDDEFEDFPVEDWGDEDTDMAQGVGPNGEANAHLWEESWDDDEQNEDFANMLKEEMKKVESSKK